MNKLKQFFCPYKYSYIMKLKILKISLIIVFFIILFSFLIGPMFFIDFKSRNSFFEKEILNTLLNKEVDAPTFSGSIGNGGSYHLSANKVTNNIFDFNKKNNNLIILSKPVLLYSSPNKVIFKIVSTTANIDLINQTATMPNDVLTTSNAHHKLYMKNVYIDMKNKIIYSNKPLYGSYEKITLVANGVKINNFGDIIILNGPVIIKTQGFK